MTVVPTGYYLAVYWVLTMVGSWVLVLENLMADQKASLSAALLDPPLFEGLV
jgi:hypothetical protein